MDPSTVKHVKLENSTQMTLSSDAPAVDCTAYFKIDCGVLLAL